MPSPNDTILGALVPINIPQTLCVEGGTPELLKTICQYLAVQVPASITNVVIQEQQPGEDARNSLWVRRLNSGDVIGIYIYSDVKWIQLFPTPNGVFWMYGDSRDVPPGYLLIDINNQKIASSARTHIMAQYNEVTDGSGTYYNYFATTFEGI